MDGEEKYLFSVTLGGGIHILDLIYWIAKSRCEILAVPNNLNSKKKSFRYNNFFIKTQKWNYSKSYV